MVREKPREWLFRGASQGDVNKENLERTALNPAVSEVKMKTEEFHLDLAPSEGH